jgi:ubiquinol-cytochrome c reductase cytochrome c subunit
MPKFGPEQIDQHELDSIVRYVELTKHPDDRGGWGLGHVGPVPEGMVAWLLAGTVLVLVARLLGKRVE